MSDSTTNVNDTTEQPVPEQKVAIQLNVRDLNLVMAALQELPHRAVDALLRDIQD